MDSPNIKSLKLYAIEVTHTKKGEPRKRRAWWGHNTCRPVSFFFWHICVQAALFESRNDAKRNLCQAEIDTSCKCRVVEFEEKKDG